MRVAASWSGGKDSCLACYLAMGQGHQVTHLWNFISAGTRSVSAHGVSGRLIRRQAQATGIPLVQYAVPDGPGQYELRLKRAVSILRRDGLEGMVFGDIYLQEHRDWIERVCRDMGITPLLPLWGMKSEQVLQQFLDSGFESVIVSARASALGPEWLGRRLDEACLVELRALCQQKGIDVCGEGGEYHTLVVNGPLFRKRLRLTLGDAEQRDGQWYVSIRRSYIVEKG